MDQTPKLCPKCQQANFPVAEFCRHCGEPIFEMGALSRTSFLSRWIGHIVDGLFWVVDELARWWEIIRIVIELKSLKNRRATLMKRVSEQGDTSVPTPERDAIVQISEDISRLSGREEFLRTRSWAMTPELLLVGFILCLVGGVIWLRPRTDALPPVRVVQANLQDRLETVRDLPLADHTVVTTAAWYGDRLAVGGDAGVTLIDPATGLASAVVGLPDQFQARHLVEESTRLLIAGYRGVLGLDARGLTPVYEESRLPVALINRIAPVKSGHLLGTVGSGLMHGRNGIALVVLGTQGQTVLGFAWVDGELWMLSERGLSRGDGTTFTPVSMPVLANRRLTSLAADGNTLYIGTDDGVVAGLKNGGAWVWTPLLAGGPRAVRDLLAVNGTLLVLGQEGLFRYRDGRYEKLAEPINGRVMSLGPRLLAVAGPGRVSLYAFVPAQGAGGSLVPVVPSVGTFSPLLAPSAAPLPPGTPVQPAVLPIQGSQVPVPSVGPVLSGGSPAPAPAPSLPSPAGTFLGSPLPPALQGQGATSLAWDGRRLWVGTTNQGLWQFLDGTWTGFSKDNGGLSDNQVVSLWQADGGRTFLFSWALGLMGLESGRPTQVLPINRLDGFLGLAGDGAAPVFLFEGGILRRLDGNRLADIRKVPGGQGYVLRHLLVVRGVIHLVADEGVVVFNEQENRWVLYNFPREAPERALFAVSAPDGTIYVAGAQGTIFSYLNTRTARVGSIGEGPKGLAFGGMLCAATKNGLFRLRDGALMPMTPPTGASIQGCLMIPEKRTLVLNTTAGLFSVSLDS